MFVMGIYKTMEVGPTGFALLATAATLLFVTNAARFWLLAFRKLQSQISTQFRLRTLLVGTTLFGMLCAKAAVETRTLQHKWQLYTSVRIHGGELALGRSTAPNWLLDWLIDKLGVASIVAMCPVEDVSFNNPTHDRLATELRGLPVKNLCFGPGSRLRDSQLALLAKSLPRLRELYVYCPTVTDDGVRHVSAFTELRRLDLAFTGVTDRSVGSLTRLRQLTHLNLSNTQITDGAVAQLSHLKQLERLELAGTMLTDQSLRQLVTALPHTLIVGPDGRPCHQH